MAYRKRIKYTDEQKQDIWGISKRGVSREALYRSLYVQARGALKKELVQYHRETRTIRRSRSGKPATDMRGKIPDAVPISESPASVEDCADQTCQAVAGRVAPIIDLGSGWGNARPLAVHDEAGFPGRLL